VAVTVFMLSDLKTNKENARPKNVEMDLDVVCFRLSCILNILPAISMVDEGLNYKSNFYFIYI
jgi:hypothetical protein